MDAITCSQRSSRSSQSVSTGRVRPWSSAPPAVDGDRDQLAERGVELHVASDGRCRARSTSRISAFGRRFDEHDEAEAVARLVLRVQARELGEHLRLGVGALLRGRPCETSPTAGRSRGARREPRSSRSSGSSWTSVRARSSERILVGEPLDEPRPALEELGELVGASAPAVARASVGRDEQRDVVVAVARARSRARRAVKKGDGGWKTSAVAFRARARRRAGARPSASVSAAATSAPSRAARRERRRPAVRRRCRARGWRARRVITRACRLAAVRAGDLRLVAPARARRRARRPRRRRRAGRPDAAREARAPRRDRRPRRAPARPSARRRSRPACPARASRCRRGRSTAAPPRVPSRSASRAVIAAGAAAAARDEQRLLHLEEEVASARSRPIRRRRARRAPRRRRARGPARRRRRAAGSTSGSARRRCPSRRSGATSLVARGGRSARTRRRPPSQPRRVEVLDRRAAVQLAAVRLLLDRLGQVRVQRQAEPPRQRRPTPPSAGR